MKRKSILIVLAIFLIGLIPAGSVAAWTSDDIRSADAYSDPVDYSLIIMDRDGWELRMNLTIDHTSYSMYSGILLYGYGSTRYKGDLKAVYYKTKQLLLVTCTDTGWHNYTLSYSLQKSDGSSTYLDRTWDMNGLYLYFETGASYTIGADIVKGSLW